MKPPALKLLLLLVIPLSAFLASCSTTPATRIQQNPALYSKLSPKHQELVRQGKIDRGMTKPAVFLAMGNPDSKIAGKQHGKSFERWNYNVMVPVYYHGFHPYYGYGYRGCGRYRGHYGLYYHPSVHYEPRHGASVTFKHGRVSGWSSVQRNF